MNVALTRSGWTLTHLWLLRKMLVILSGFSCCCFPYTSTMSKLEKRNVPLSGTAVRMGQSCVVYYYTTVNRRSTRAEATRRAPTFKFMARRVVWAALGDPRQHREATPRPSSRTGAGTSHCPRTQRCDPRPWQWDSRTAQVRNESSTETATRASCHEARTRPREPATHPSTVWAVRVSAVVWKKKNPHCLTYLIT